MIRSLSSILPTTTSHGVGNKRVLLSSNESDCSLTQIAVTELTPGEIATAHVHPDMQEAFFVLEGEIEITLDGRKTVCHKDDFVYVDRCTSHELRPLTPTRILTIGCVIEASRHKLYPMLFKPNHKNLVWGTEDWTVSAVPGSESEIENGTWARYKLTEVIAKLPTEILGKQVAQRYDNQMPLLSKIIDAREDLSIQVHPNDDMAQREHGKMGKSEMWYILDAEPGAYLYAGFREHITPEEFQSIISDPEQSSRICELLAKHPVHRGDVFYLPSGRVHAICGGIRLAEIQQSSDVTYRIYDYDRPGLDGKPRELHTDLAAQAIDFNVYPDYKTDSRTDSLTASELLNTPFFSINVVDTAFATRRNMVKYDSFVLLMNLQGDCKIRTISTRDEILLPAGTSCLIPAAVADYEVIPTTFDDQGRVQVTRILEAFINNHKTLTQKLSDFLHLE